MPQIAAIVYGEQSGIIGRFVISDSIDELGMGKHYNKGESIILLNPEEIAKNGVPDLDKAYELVEEKRGKPSENNRCLLIDSQTGTIEKVILSDPYLEKEQQEGKVLYQHPTAEIDWVLDDKGDYVPPIKEVPVETEEIELS